ncbi:MAG: hypothetical protein JO253_04225, partial [Alphaproteobacteria bacterium]|nr:hypothetical protein [Alphaproteobacteria bacterium]
VASSLTAASAHAGTYANTLVATGAVDSDYTISYVPGTLTILPLAGTINAGTFLKSFTDVQTAPITLVNASAIFYLVAQPAMDFPTVQNSSRTDDMLIGFEKN